VICNFTWIFALSSSFATPLILCFLSNVHTTMRIPLGSVAMAIADVFSKNGYTIPNKNAEILKIFGRLETLKRWWVISQR
jgi:hypothetical protein